MIATQVRLSAQIVLVTFVFNVSLTTSITAQEISPSDLVVQLRTGNAQDVAKAIRSLPADLLNHDDVVGLLTLLLNDERIVEKHLMGRETVRNRAWFKLLDLQPTSVLSILRRVPELKSDRARGLAFEAISRVGKANAEAYSLLLAYRNDDDVYVRSRAISALSAVGDNDTKTIKQFGELLHDPHPMVRWTVLNALDKRHAQVASLVPEIINLLDDNSDVYFAISNDILGPKKLRGRAARLLASIGPDAKGGLAKLKRLTKPEFNTNVRIWAATAVCTISDTPPPDALALLGKLLLADINNEHVHNDASEAITKLGTRAAPLLDQLERAKTHASSSVRWGVVDTFFAVDPASAVSKVLPMIDDKDELVAETVIEALNARKISEPAVIDAYIRALGSRDDIFDQPASSAIDALANLGADAKPAIPALEQLGRDTRISKTLREDVNRALARIR